MRELKDSLISLLDIGCSLFLKVVYLIHKEVIEMNIDELKKNLKDEVFEQLILHLEENYTREEVLTEICKLVDQYVEDLGTTWK